MCGETGWLNALNSDLLGALGVGLALGPAFALYAYLEGKVSWAAGAAVALYLLLAAAFLGFYGSCIGL